MGFERQNKAGDFIEGKKSGDFSHATGLQRHLHLQGFDGLLWATQSGFENSLITIASQ
jgi:hypothetical protein